MWMLRASAMAAAAGGFIGRAVPSSQSLRSMYLTSFTTSRLIAPFTSSALDKDKDKDTVEDVKRILEMAKQASLRRQILHTDFLTPPVLKEAMIALEKIADIKMVVQGGYPKAERRRLSVGHPDVLTSAPYIVAAMSISGNFRFKPCIHDDFLTSILGTGIVRDKLGDILLQGEKGAQFLVVPELVDFLMSSLDKVRNVSVTCKKIPLLALEYQPPRTKPLKTMDRSQRLNAIARARFTRSNIVDLISNGDVRVHWPKGNTTLKAGNIISASGKGRLLSTSYRGYNPLHETATERRKRRTDRMKKNKAKRKGKPRGSMRTGSFIKL